MILRLANVDDVPAIAALHAQSWRTFYRGSLTDQYLDGDITEERRGVWTSRLSTATRDQLVVLAEAEGRLLGFACAYLDAHPTWGALLDNLHVAASEHRRGIGRALIRSVITWVQENRETSPLHLWLLQSNASARAFYEAQGGRIVGTDLWEPPGGSPRVPRFRMAWPAASQMRSAIRAEFESICPLDALERQHRSDALAWIDSGAALFRTQKPAIPPKHLVSYFAVVDGERILLVDHKNAELWLPPGGHVEQGEHPRATVLREVREELGFEPAHEIAAPLMVTCTTTVGLTAGHFDVSLWYVVHAEKDQHLTFDANEFHGIKWFGYSEVPFERSDPHLARFIRKLRSDTAIC